MQKWPVVQEHQIEHKTYVPFIFKVDNKCKIMKRNNQYCS